ncbi:MAG TPA: major capsid protein [Leptospiraceae bacterium]|nr:major capsid protein [Leptospiraceae bacterium]
MTFNSFRFLDNVKINAIVQTLADSLEKEDKLLFLNRTEVVNADDEEIITGKWKSADYAADIIPDNQEAPTYEAGSMQFTTNVIPKIKIGKMVPESIIKRVTSLSRNLATPTDEQFFTNWEYEFGESLVRGIRKRVNDMICAMQRDSFTYDRFGVKLTNQTWGMPSDLKVTAGVDWSDAVNSTPITDLQTIAVDTAPDAYGEQFNRVTMSSRAFKYITLSNEFQNRIKGELRYNFGAGQINTKDTGAMRQLLANIINMEVEIYDETYWTKSSNGTKVRQRVLPYNQVIFSNTSDDNNRDAMYFANGVVTESIVGTLYGYDGFDGAAFGPITYYEPGKNLNPPNVEAFSVLRGYPIKVRETCTAVLTVGSGNNWV